MRQSLTQFIRLNHHQIIQEWLEFARSVHPWSDGMSEEDLADHAEDLLNAVVADMESRQSASEQAKKSKGLGQPGALTRIGHKHASDRLESGFKLDQLVSEYRALRASVIQLWSEAQGDKRGELTRFNEAIDQSLAEAAIRYTELMNRTREQFLAILAHDLRNPLSAIIMGASVLTNSESIDDTKARVAMRILNSASRMNRMVDYLLDLARTRLGGSIPLTTARVDLGGVCRQVISELKVVHPHRELFFKSSGDLSGEWDSDRLAQVVSNLAANALQYSTAAVDVVAWEDGEEVVLAIHNEGPAIPKSTLKDLFEPMMRTSEPGGDGNPLGLGLGLYIAREIVTAHEGTVEVTSSEKEGTTFTVTLPHRPAPKRRHNDRGQAKDSARPSGGTQSDAKSASSGSSPEGR